MYLGHVIFVEGIKPHLVKVVIVENFMVPKCGGITIPFGTSQLLHKVIKAFTLVAMPLYHHLKKGVLFRWTKNEDSAFEAFKLAMCTSPMLIYSRFDQPLLLQTESSRDVVVAILHEKIDDQEYVVTYASHTMSKAKKNYVVIDKEELAITFVVTYFRPYIYGAQFTIETDHAP